MKDILEVFPGAQRALFQKYHIGGCSSCGFSASDTLEQVFINHRRPQETENAVKFIQDSARLDEEIQIDPVELKAALDRGEEWHIIDVREPEEAQIVSIPGSQLITRELAYQMMEKWPKDSKIAFYCHSGIRSLEAAVYFKGHGIANVRSLKGGVDLWAQSVDPGMARY